MRAAAVRSGVWEGRGFCRRGADNLKKSAAAEFDFRELESRTNLNTIKALRITTTAFFLVWLLTVLGIFTVNQILMTQVFVVSSALMLLPGPICRLTGTHKGFVKYMLLAFSAAAITVICSALTYHSVLLFALPLIYAAQYSDRHMIIYAYALTVAGVFVSVMFGYFNGICDANMLFLTNHRTAFYADIQAGTLNLSALRINPNPWVSLPLFFVLPRCFVLAVLVPVLRKISSTIRESAAMAARLRLISETDKATHFYNRNKYEEMLESYYSKLDRLGVIFWDINNLKQVNDSYGHAYGDTLISSVAGCIYELAQGRNVYRLGGDEFVMFLEGDDVANMEALLERWRELIEAEQRTNALPVSAAVGSASGAGRDVTELISHADAEMYRDKRRNKWEAAGPKA